MTSQRFPKQATLRRLTLVLCRYTANVRPLEDLVTPFLSCNAAATRLSALTHLQLGDEEYDEQESSLMTCGAEVFSQVAEACPALRWLDLHLVSLHPSVMACLTPLLLRLGSLRELRLSTWATSDVVASPATVATAAAELERAAQSSKSDLRRLFFDNYPPNTASSDGGIPLLMEVQRGVLRMLLPALAQLPRLDQLVLLDHGDVAEHHKALDGGILGLTEHLSRLQHLTSLSWTCDGSAGGIALRAAPSLGPQATIRAIYCLGHLAALDLRSYSIRDDGCIRLLAEMPSLRTVAFWALRPSEKMVCCRCAWERLSLGEASLQDLARLPLSGVRRLDIGGPLICRLGPGSSSGAIFASAVELGAAAELLARNSPPGKSLELALSWDRRVSLTLAQAKAIFSALAPLRWLARGISLEHFGLDDHSLRELAEMLPALQRLRLDYVVLSGGPEAWATLCSTFPSLSDLRVQNSPFKTQKEASEAMFANFIEASGRDPVQQSGASRQKVLVQVDHTVEHDEGDSTAGCGQGADRTEEVAERQTITAMDYDDHSGGLISTAMCGPWPREYYTDEGRCKIALSLITDERDEY